MGIATRPFDAEFCLSKEAEYHAKAGRAYDPKIKAALEATARDFADQARRLKEQKRL